MFLQLRNKTQSIGILLLPTISLQNDMRTTYAPFKCLQLSSAPLYLFFLRLISAQISQGENVYSQHTFVSLLIEEFSEISASSIYFVSIFLSRWTGCPKSGQREQHFPLMLSPCWIISPQICTPCPSSALPLQLWTVRAALHGPTLRESTSPSTGRWVYTHTFFRKIWTNRIFFCSRDWITLDTRTLSVWFHVVFSCCVIYLFFLFFLSLSMKILWTWLPSSPALLPRSTVTCTVKAAVSELSTPTSTGPTTSPTCWATVILSSLSLWGSTSLSTGAT